jgi:hypothetical protein
LLASCGWFGVSCGGNIAEFRGCQTVDNCFFACCPVCFLILDFLYCGFSRQCRPLESFCFVILDLGGFLFLKDTVLCDFLVVLVGVSGEFFLGLLDIDPLYKIPDKVLFLLLIVVEIA